MMRWCTSLQQQDSFDIIFDSKYNVHLPSIQILTLPFFSFYNRHAMSICILLQPLCRGGRLWIQDIVLRWGNWTIDDSTTIRYDNRLIWNPYTNKGSSSGLSYMTRLWKGKGDGVDSSNATQALACSSPSITCSGNSIWIYSFAEAARLSLVLPNPWEQVD